MFNVSKNRVVFSGKKITDNFSFKNLESLYFFEINDFLKIGLSENLSKKIHYTLPAIFSF